LRRPCKPVRAFAKARNRSKNLAGFLVRLEEVVKVGGAVETFGFETGRRRPLSGLRLLVEPGR
jgi:hypothetical protein